MNNTKQYAISLDIPVGWAPTGEYRRPVPGDTWLAPNGTARQTQVGMNIGYIFGCRIILKKVFVPKPLEHGKRYRLPGDETWRYLCIPGLGAYWVHERTWQLIKAYSLHTAEGQIEEIINTREIT